jgi:hypothetical protein
MRPPFFLEDEDEDEDDEDDLLLRRVTGRTGTSSSTHLRRGAAPMMLYAGMWVLATQGWTTDVQAWGSDMGQKDR